MLVNINGKIVDLQPTTYKAPPVSSDEMKTVRQTTAAYNAAAGREFVQTVKSLAYTSALTACETSVIAADYSARAAHAVREQSNKASNWLAKRIIARNAR